jgi:hypothetical protein
MRERVSGGDVCDCCFGEQLDNKKPFRPLYIFKHMLKNNFVLFVKLSLLSLITFHLRSRYYHVTFGQLFCHG